MIIKRSVFPDLVKHLKNDEISFLIGPRQSGKTTLLLELIEVIKKDSQKYIFFNLDLEEDFSYFASQMGFLQKIRSLLGNTKGYVFIDEIQKKGDAGVFLKGLYDMNLPYKFVVTGSGSLELKEKIYESLAGRKRMFNIYPLDFYEFVDFKTGYNYSSSLHEFFKVNKNESRRLLEEYMTFGGYPKVVLGETNLEKRSSLGDIYKSFMERDIQILLNVEKSESFSNLLKVIGSQNGRLVNYNELSNTLGLSLPTVKNYLWYLEKTFILSKSYPFFRNVRKEITKSPIYYFIDLGLRNYLLNIQDFNSCQDKGFLFQNFIYNEIGRLLEQTSISRKFWRTKEKAEIDIVLDTYPTPIPVEVKYREAKNIKLTRAMRSFMKKYSANRAFVVGLSAGENEKIIPYYELSKISP